MDGLSGGVKTVSPLRGRIDPGEHPFFVIFLSLEIGVDAPGGTIPHIEGLDERGRSRNTIPAGKNPFLVRSAGDRIHPDFIAWRQHLSVPLRQERRVDFLTDRRNDHIRLQGEVGTLHGDGFSAAAAVRLTQSHLHAFQPLDAPPFAVYLQRRRQVANLHPFFQGLFNFLRQGRHLRPGAAVENFHMAKTEAETTPGTVHGDIPPAQNEDFFYRLDVGTPLLYFPQEIDPLHKTFNQIIFSGQADIRSPVGADGQKEGFESLFLQIIPLQEFDSPIQENIHTHPS